MACLLEASFLLNYFFPFSFKGFYLKQLQILWSRMQILHIFKNQNIRLTIFQVNASSYWSYNMYSLLHKNTSVKKTLHEVINTQN